MPDPGVQLDLGQVFQSLADYQTKRETMGRQWLFVTQKLLDKINDLCNLAMEHRYPLMECGFLEPMQENVKELIEVTCQGIEIHGYDADHLLTALKEINELVEEAVEEHERWKRAKR